MSRQSSISSYGGTAPSATSSCFLDLDAARLRLQRSESRRSATQEQLLVLAKMRASTPNMSPEELTFKDREIQALKQQLSALEAEVMDCKSKLHDAETTITQQRMTIHTQSKAIENPGAGRDVLIMPAHHGYSYVQPNATQHHIGPVKPTVFGHSNQPLWRPAHRSTLSNQSASTTGTPIHGRDRAFDSIPTSHTVDHFMSDGTRGYETGRNRLSNNPSMDRSRSQSRPVDHGNPPAYSQRDVMGNQIRHSDGVNPMMNQLKPPQNLQSPLSATSSNPYPETSIPRTLMLSAANSADAGNEPTIQKAFQDFIDMTLKWARNHANIPSTAGDNALPQSMKDKLLKAGTNNGASKLLSDGSTRYLLVSRIMLQWIIKHVFKIDKPNTFSGLNENADKAIQTFTEMIIGGMPTEIRFAHLNTIAAYYRAICDNERFPAFVEHLCEQRGQLLWQRICPLMHKTFMQETSVQKRSSEPERDLLKLMYAAHKLAALMHTDTDEFQFLFLDIDAPFHAETMISIDPLQIKPQPRQLEVVRALVRLNISPVIRSRKNTPQGPVMESVIAQALVLIKVPGKQS